MRSFIEEVVDALYDEYGDQISSVKIVLPNKRAELFFREALCKRLDRALWSPEFISLQNLTHSLSSISVVDNVRLIVELYKVYSEFHNQPLDAFYFWGEVLLSDFDAIDKYLIDANVLFSNIEDIKQLDADVSYLTEEQIEIISRFGHNLWLDPQPGKEKERFIAVWKTLAPIYHKFKEALLSKGIAYEGMAQRIVAERVKNNDEALFEGGHFAMVGFNALTECEKRLFKAIKSGAERAHFFWDYDDSYLKNRENQAGIFVRNNISIFEQFQSMTVDFKRNHLSRRRNIKVLSAPSDSIQCKYVETFLQDIIKSQGKVDKQTAIVLTDENLLLPVLYSLPKELETVNITMGYPLIKSMAYAFVDRLIELQRHKRERSGVVQFYHREVVELLTHPYTTSKESRELVEKISKRQIVYVPLGMLSSNELSSLIFRNVDNAADLSRYITDVMSFISTNNIGDSEDLAKSRDFTHTIVDALDTLNNSLSYCDIDIPFSVMTSLIRKMLQTIRIPYEGEPLEGLQIMGILETRNLDFKNLLILSACDDTFPGNRVTSTSFIPYNLRFAYGLPTPQHHEGVYAYYFYRLIQRAENIVLAYSSLSDEKKTGEPSRYIYQLEYGGEHNIEHIDLSLNVNSQPQEQFSIIKDSAVMERLEQYCNGGRSFSPTSILNYIECPMKFCLRYIEGIKPKDEVTEEIDMPTFGTILHKAMETLYTPLVGSPSLRSKIKDLRGSKHVERAVDQALESEYYKESNISEADYSGEIMLIKDIVIKYINSSILSYDIAIEEFSVKDVELDLKSSISFSASGKQYSAAIEGLADRVDLLADGSVRIVDYKTGSEKKQTEFKSVEALFGDSATHRNRAALQTLLYSKMLYDMQGGSVQPALYFVRFMGGKEYTSELVMGGAKISGYSALRTEVDERLSSLLSDMFDTSRAFEQTQDHKSCSFCDYADICRRKTK